MQRLPLPDDDKGEAAWQTLKLNKVDGDRQKDLHSLFSNGLDKLQLSGLKAIKKKEMHSKEWGRYVFDVNDKYKDNPIYQPPT